MENGIPLAEIKGTGPNGRIIEVGFFLFFSEWLTNNNDQADVKNYKPSAAAASTSAAGKPAAVPADYEDIPTSNMRRTIGMRLTESKQQLPHYYVTVEVNMGEFKSYARLGQC